MGLRLALVVLLLMSGCAKPAVHMAPPEPVWKLPSALSICAIVQRTHYSDGTWRIVLECSDGVLVAKR